jgi:hypothetical protein
MLLLLLLLLPFLLCRSAAVYRSYPSGRSVATSFASTVILHTKETKAVPWFVSDTLALLLLLLPCLNLQGLSFSRIWCLLTT